MVKHREDSGKKNPSPMCLACCRFLVMGETLSPLSGKSPALWPLHPATLLLTSHHISPPPAPQMLSLLLCLAAFHGLFPELCWRPSVLSQVLFYHFTPHQLGALWAEQRGLLPYGAGLYLSPVLRTVKVNSPQHCVVCLLLPVNV